MLKARTPRTPLKEYKRLAVSPLRFIRFLKLDKVTSLRRKKIEDEEGEEA